MRSIASVILLLATSTLLTNCKSIPEEVQEKFQYNILLQKGELPEYLSSNYSTYKAQDIKRNSRSQNQYAVSFYLPSSDLPTLEKVMKADEKIIKYSNLSIKGFKVESSTNVKKL